MALNDIETTDVIDNSKLLLIYTLELNGFNETKSFRCNKFNRIHFIVGSTLYGREICLKTNYNDDYTKFSRNDYDTIDINKNFQLKSSGSFHFIYVDKNDTNNILGSFYLVVSPDIIINQTEKSISLSINALQCQTIISKLMGPIDTWKDRLKISIECNYNMIHWTPIQLLGGSNSAYSLADQLRLNPSFRTESMINAAIECTLDDVQKHIDWLKHQHGIISIVDIVLNHTANESAWLRENPESAYNCYNSPWLRPAFILDRMLFNVSIDIEKNRWKERGITSNISGPEQLEIIRSIIYEHYLPLIKIEEFFFCNIDEMVEKFSNDFIDGDIVISSENQITEIHLEQDQQYRRLKCTVNMNNAFAFITNQIGPKPSKSTESFKNWSDQAKSAIRQQLIRLNEQKKQEIANHMNSAIDNVMKGAQYERFDPNGPKLKEVNRKHPLTTEYFLDCDENFVGEMNAENEAKLYDKNSCQYYMAHNGWVMGDDPLRNFAEKDSQVYLRRELICWGDSVKLRYGQKPEDSPFLWSHMESYVIQMARIFQGLRLDNCHSTPIHVAQYMIDAARRVNPDLYLIAELFTSSEDLDNIFVNKLGINSLIREAMSAGTPHELQRQVYRFGGQPVGSFAPDLIKTQNDEGTLYSRPLIPTVTHAIFFDQTHDNESSIVRRTAYDPLPSSALISMTYSATGSNRGYDELVPHHIHVVNEHRLYSCWNDDSETNDGVNLSTGILRAKKILNNLHYKLNSCGYSEAFVDQRDRDTIVITRHNPVNHKSIVLAARTAFYSNENGYNNYLEPLKIEGKFEKILFEAKMIKTENDSNYKFERNEKIINGLRNLHSTLNIDTLKSEMIHITSDENINLIEFKKFPPSSVIALSFALLPKQNEAVNSIKNQIQQYDLNNSDIYKIISKLNLIDLNYVLFRCQPEEWDENSSGTYQLSNGPLVYCGIAGIMFYLTKIRTTNDLGHPLCKNLREGNWLPEYIVERLSKRERTQELSKWLKKTFEYLYELPRYLIPRYFDSILCPLWTILLEKCRLLYSDFVKNGDDFIRRLALGSVALISSHPASPLPKLDSSIVNSQTQLASLAAGLPHFSTGYMRNWGRDTFISLKGLTLLTGRFDEAKIIILAYGGCLRHGLIPNLLDGGNNSRYNCRDAVWWWLQAIKEYIQLVPNGHSILNENVNRIFPKDDSHENDNLIEPLHCTMQEALNKHLNGIDFVEKNAGTQIDAHMTMNGFHIKIGVDRETGFVFGGNQWNCGTWMDKMGSSDKAGNRGRPATPRDGSAVEIVALSQSVVEFLAKLYDNNQYPYEGVSDSNSKLIWSFKEWNEKILGNFEKYFYINDDCSDQYVNRRQIYKDTLNATIRWMDYQLRPNFLVAMTIAPKMFSKSNAIKALDIVSKTLVGPLGMKTLDPSDWTYRGDYDNSNDSNDPTVANGFNYHNGPEWLWLMGYYLMSRLMFIDDNEPNRSYIEQIMSKHFHHLTQSEWYGLPELTNADGRYCSHSCPIQSWSHATLIETLYMMKMKSEEK